MIKSKITGFLLIVIGALPFLLKIDAVSEFFGNYGFLGFVMPGEIGYQILIILLGVWLIWTVKPKMELRR